MQLLNILGPVMIGPSSSHTAGAARIGRIALHLLGEPVAEAEVGFCGSFAKTGQGHGTDRAVVGGLMDMDTADARLRDSLKLAEEAGVRVRFETIALKDAHPNTVRLRLTGVNGKKLEMIAASTGGGSVEVREIDRLPISFTGEAHTLIICHRDAPGMIASVSSLLAGASVNIATMRLTRQAAGRRAIMVLELDAMPDPAIISALKTMTGISDVTMLKRLA